MGATGSFAEVTAPPPLVVDVDGQDLSLLFLDLELARSGKLEKVGALLGSRVLDAAPSSATWSRLADMAHGAAAVVGHNLIAHDLVWLHKHMPDHPVSSLPAVDTLWLSPLAFPERPYHRLLKEDKLLRDYLPDPVADCRACHRVLVECLDELRRWHRRAPALSAFIRSVLTNPEVSPRVEAYSAILPGDDLSVGVAWEKLSRALDGRACLTALDEISPDREQQLPLAHLSAWIHADVPGSVVPFWVTRAYPEVSTLARRLRGSPCTRPDCSWCGRRRDPRTMLRQWWGFEEFRALPEAPGGGSLQRALVEAGLRGEPLFGVLPTGGGKSICFQLPAIVRHRDLGQLTVVLSPLQSLMKDQVDHLTEKDPHATAIYGALPLLERRDRISRVRDGHADLLYVAPEQLRNPGLRDTLEMREIGAWVFDEAHCLSKWGHDFRPDYLYAPRFIRELSERQGVAVPPVQCFTATAQREVLEEIRQIFIDEVGQDLRVFDGGTARVNLSYLVEQVRPLDKPQRIAELIEEHLGGGRGACVVFAATRAQTERLARTLSEYGVPAHAYHAGLNGESRREVQDAFLAGASRVICATSAFGMGVDKPDIRLVIHHDVPGSLESYLQQAGRAGRDGEAALCVLLFQPSDIDTQFQLDGYSRIEYRDLVALWRAIRAVPYHLDSSADGVVERRVVTAGELIRLDAARGVFDPGDPRATDRVGTAVRWLERSGVVARDENRTSVFSGRPRLPCRADAEKEIAKLHLVPAKKERWFRILDQLYMAGEGEGISADDLAEIVDPDARPLAAGRAILSTLYDMAKAGLVTSGQQCLVLLREGIRDSSTVRLRRCNDVERELISVFAEEAPDADGEWSTVRPRMAARRLPELAPRPAEIRRVMQSLTELGQGIQAGVRCADVRTFGDDTMLVRLRYPWPKIAELAATRRDAMAVFLAWLRGQMPSGERKAGIPVAFTVEDLAQAVEADIALKPRIRSAFDLTTHSLLWMDRARVLKLGNGLAVFRQAMTLRRRPGSREKLHKGQDYAPLEHHYAQRTIQIHVMGEYAQRGAEDIVVAERLASDWFEMPKTDFLDAYFSGRKEMLKRATSQESWHRIVESLRSKAQERIVTSRPDRNALVLAGPGSGKTRVLVHRVAWLLRVKRVRPSSVLVLCYTRANTLELRRRLKELAGDEARHVSVMTLHGLALRMVEVTPERDRGEEGFRDLLRQATALLNGNAPLPGGEQDRARDELLRGYRHILVDEYQDLDEEQYALLSAVAGRTENDPEAKLTIFAVGDDDQNIYAFRGASTEFLRRFEQDYSAQRFHLLENYRSTQAIIDAASSLLSDLPDRLKADQVLRVADVYRGRPRGGRLEAVDSVSRGRVRRVSCRNGTQLGLWVADEIRRILAVDGESFHRDIAVLSASRAGLAPVRLALERTRQTTDPIPFTWPLPSGAALPLGRVREGVRAHEVIDSLPPEGVTPAELVGRWEVEIRDESPWRELVLSLGEELKQRWGGHRVDPGKLSHLLWEATSTARREQMIGTGVHLGTLHGAKGLEFRHVLLVDDALSGRVNAATCRLAYVGMTRAQESLTLCVRQDCSPSILHRVSVVKDVTAPSVEVDLQERSYDLLTPDHLWIDFAGRRHHRDLVHKAIDELRFGQELWLKKQAGHLRLADASGHPVATLTPSAEEKLSARRDLRLKVVALERRTKDMSGTEYADRLKAGAWYLPWCELRWALQKKERVREEDKRRCESAADAGADGDPQPQE